MSSYLSDRIKHRSPPAQLRVSMKETPNLTESYGRRIPLVLCLAVYNTMACVGAYFPLIMQETTHMPSHHELSVFLNFLGIGIAFKWSWVASRTGYRAALVLSSALLCILHVVSLATPYSPRSIFLLQLSRGVVGSAPVYLAPEIFARCHEGFAGTNSRLMTLATLCGLATGPILQLKFSSAIILGVFSAAVALLSLVYVPSGIVPPASVENEHTDDQQRLEAFGALGVIEGVNLGFFASILLLICVPKLMYGFDSFMFGSRVWSWDLITCPLYGILGGCILGIAFSPRLMHNKLDKFAAERFTTWQPKKLAASVIAQEAIIWSLSRLYKVRRQKSQEDFIYVFVSCLVWGYMLVAQVEPCLSLEVDMYSIHSSQESVVMPACRYLACATVTWFATLELRDDGQMAKFGFWASLFGLPAMYLIRSAVAKLCIMKK